MSSINGVAVEDRNTSSSDEGALPIQFQHVPLRPYSLGEGLSRLNLDDSSLPALEQVGPPFMDGLRRSNSGESPLRLQQQATRSFMDMEVFFRSRSDFGESPSTSQPVQRAPSPFHFQPIHRVPQSVSATGPRTSNAAAVSSDTTTDDDGSSDISEESEESDTGESSMECYSSSSSEPATENTDSDTESLSSGDESKNFNLNSLKLQQSLADQLVNKLDEDEDDEISKRPFRKLRESMFKVTCDGKIVKMISKGGTGDNPEDNDLVSVIYKTYKEYKDESTDHVLSVTAEKPCKFKLGTYLEGFNIAVSSMQPNEIAWFLIHPDYIYGKYGFLPHIPPSTTILYKIMLMNTVRSGAADDYKYLTTSDKKNFDTVQKVVLGLIELARDHFKKNLDKSVRQYKRAKKLLSYKGIKGLNKATSKWIANRLISINCNLAMCYNRQLRSKKACTVCIELLQLAKKHSLPVPIKGYFHYGRALRFLNKYTKAIEQLKEAQKLSPNNSLVEKEIDRVKFKRLKNRETKAKNKAGSITLYLRDISKETEEAEDSEDLDFPN